MDTATCQHCGAKLWVHPDHSGRYRYENKQLRTSGILGSGSECPENERGHEPKIAVTLDIENIYPDGTIRTIVETEIDNPLDEADEGYSDWEYDNIFIHTGTGETSGDAGYFVTIEKSSRPDLIPVGAQYEFC